MQPTKKFFIFILALALIAFAIHQLKKSQESIKPVPVTQEDSPIKPGYKIYSDEAQFSFQYPKDLVAIANGDELVTQWKSNTQTLGALYVTVTIPKSTQPQTNFSEAKFSVGASRDTNEIKNCLVATNGEYLEEEVTINGFVYKKFTLSDAAAGNRYDTTSYRTIRDNSCYAIEYTIHTTNIGNYDPSQGIKEYDKASVVQTLEDMVQSFKFI